MMSFSAVLYICRLIIMIVRISVVLIEEKKWWLFSFDPSIIVKIKPTETEPTRNEVKGERLAAVIQ